MIKRFLTIEYVIKDNGETRMVVSIINDEVKKKIFYRSDELLEFLRKFFEKQKNKEVTS